MKEERSHRVCVVLASGVGRRIGGPKALLEWEGMPLAAAHGRARASDCGRVIVVTREAMAKVLERSCPWLEVIVSWQPDELGPAGSIAAAVRAGALAGARQVVVTPVDVPPAASELVVALCDALSETQAARPWLHERPGHPVACRAWLLGRGYATEAPALRDLLAGLGTDCARLETQNPDVAIDFNTPEAFAARAGHEPRFWG